MPLITLRSLLHATFSPPSLPIRRAADLFSALPAATPDAAAAITPSCTAAAATPTAASLPMFDAALRY